MVPNKTRTEPKPDPQSIRDLRLMYETASKVDGIIEYERLMKGVMSSRDGGSLHGLDWKKAAGGGRPY